MSYAQYKVFIFSSKCFPELQILVKENNSYKNVTQPLHLVITKNISMLTHSKQRGTV